MPNPNLLILGDNDFSFHRIEVVGQELERVFDGGSWSTTVTTDRDYLRGASIAEFDALIDYMTDSRLTSEQLDGLLNFVSGGGGYLGIHCAADLTLTTDGHLSEPLPELKDMIGGYFIDHPSQSRIRAKIVNSHHPITANLTDFILWDEPYELAYEDVNVLIRMDHPELPDMPIAWTKRYGDGRVFYCSLGHSELVYTNSKFRALLKNAAQWVTGSHQPTGGCPSLQQK